MSPGVREETIARDKAVEAGAVSGGGNIEEIEHKEDAMSSNNSDNAAVRAHADVVVAATPKRKWQSYIWDSFDKSPEERRFLLKLDSALLTFSCLGYFIKYLDQTNVNNAFVSGMKEDLNLYGNQLNYMQTLWSVGYVLGGLPSNILLTRVRPSIVIPIIEICWSVLTVCTCVCTRVEQIYAIRFLVGLFESALYPGMIYIIGAWYRSDELAKRTCIFQMTSAIATMFSGYLMAAVYNLDGRGGFKGWQWLFIVDGIISLPVALSGFVVLPDLPETTRAWYFTEADVTLAQNRMFLEGRAGRKPFTNARIKKIFTSWRWWCLVPLYMCWNNGGASGQPVFAQFLKDSTDPKYTVAQINTYPTTTQGLQVLFTMIFAWTSDSVFKGLRWPAIFIGGAFNIVCYSSLWAWNIPNGWRWACYVLMGPGAGLAGIAMSWAHEICSDDNEERAIVTGSMNQMAYVFQIWLPLVIWQQVSAPKYTAGFATVLWLSVGMLIMTVFTMYFHRREKMRMAEVDVDTPVLLNATDEKRLEA